MDSSEASGFRISSVPGRASSGSRLNSTRIFEGSFFVFDVKINSYGWAWSRRRGAIALILSFFTIETWVGLNDFWNRIPARGRFWNGRLETSLDVRTISEGRGLINLRHSID